MVPFIHVTIVDNHLIIADLHVVAFRFLMSKQYISDIGRNIIISNELDMASYTCKPFISDINPNFNSIYTLLIFH